MIERGHAAKIELQIFEMFQVNVINQSATVRRLGSQQFSVEGRSQNLS